MRDRIEALYRESYDKFCKTIAGRVGGLYNAEDVVQEAFYRAMKYADSYDVNGSELETWFSNILRRAMFDFKRTELQQGLVKNDMDDEEPVMEFSSLGVSTLSEVEKEIENAKERDRDILRLSFVYGYRPREISEIVDENSRRVVNVTHQFTRDMVEKYGNPRPKVLS